MENHEQQVMDLLRRQEITEAEAAKLLNLTRWDLMDKMGQYKVPVIRMTPEELREELRKPFPLAFTQYRSRDNNG